MRLNQSDILPKHQAKVASQVFRQAQLRGVVDKVFQTKLLINVFWQAKIVAAPPISATIYLASLDNFSTLKNQSAIEPMHVHFDSIPTHKRLLGKDTKLLGISSTFLGNPTRPHIHPLHNIGHSRNNYNY